MDKYYDDFVKGMASQSGKVFAITGTTSGTGFEAARALVGKGGTVFCLNRPSDRASASLASLQEACADGGAAKQIDCDLQDFASVRAAAATVAAETTATGINALLNNAGVMMQPAKATKDGYDVQMQTNHLSHFLLTSLLMPSLETAAAKTGEARIVNHSSSLRNLQGKPEPLEPKYMKPLADGLDIGGKSMADRTKRYQQSKLSNSVFTLALKDKLAERSSKVKSLVCHPGLSQTSLIPNMAASMPMGWMITPILRLVLRSQGPGDGALPLLAATVNPDANTGDFYYPSFPGSSGKMYKDQMAGPPTKLDWEARAELERCSTDKEAHKLLWGCSEEAIGGPFFPSA